MKIYNSLTRSKDDFVPLEDGRVRMYVCGMTVYDYCHIGHARVLVVFDVVVRYLRHRGYDVTYVRNVTDIDDKIIARAAERGEDIAALTERFIDAMHDDADALGVLPPDDEPRATGHIPAIIAMIEELLRRGHAYQGDNADVYYDVSSFGAYGRLSGRDPQELRAGARIEVNEAKSDPLDFVLWKAAKPGEPAWESPWGPGRPGWHIECSAMSTERLGPHFDIHGGGMDLQFPHHENEIAQSCGATGEPFVNVWMHNGFVRVDDEKMSKSLGNFFTVREVMARYVGEEIRYFILASHYRSPLNYADDQLDNARSGLTRLYTALRDLPDPVSQPPAPGPYTDRFRAAMDDDFNTPEALAVLFELAREINREREREPERAAQLGAELRTLGSVLGLLGDDPEHYLKGGAETQGGLSDAEVEQAIAERQRARFERDFGEADRIRDRLQAAGIVLEDSADGTRWRRGS